MSSTTSSPSSDHPLLKRHKRRPVELRGYLVRTDGEIVDVRVLDLSFDGCGIHLFTQLAPGEEVKLSVLSRGAVKAIVRWCTARKAGLRFVSDSAARKPSPRRAERRVLAGQAVLRRAGGPPFTTQAFDLSSHGCCCEFVERPQIDERVWIKFDGLESVEANVSWVEGSSAGFRFSKPIHPAVLDMLLHRLGGLAAP
jgi:hypothetical protein